MESLAQKKSKKTAFLKTNLFFKDTFLIIRSIVLYMVIHDFMMFSQNFLELLFQVQNFVDAARLKSSLQLTPKNVSLPFSPHPFEPTIEPIVEGVNDSLEDLSQHTQNSSSQDQKRHSSTSQQREAQSFLFFTKGLFLWKMLEPLILKFSTISQTETNSIKH